MEPRRWVWFALTVAVAGCAGRSSAPAEVVAPVVVRAKRPLPYPVTRPAAYERAIANGTRTADGAPGPNYWQQWTRYDLRARLYPDERRLEGSGTIVYHNQSPDTLNPLYLQLIQNVHSRGAPRMEEAEVTGGVELQRVVADGQALRSDVDSGPRYRVNSTRLALYLPRALTPGDSTRLEIEWAFPIPQAGASGRMGWSEENLYFIAYWYPQMAVYDDVIGWQTDLFLNGSEFYAGFGTYDVAIEAPEGWVILATGQLQNPDEVLAPRIAERVGRAEASDDVVHVITEQDFGRATRAGSPRGRLNWRFHADSVRDVAFSATLESIWDAARTPVGDRDGDGRTDYARVDALYRGSAPRWSRTWRYAQHSIDFLSRYTGLAYPWPHMTAVEGGGIIGGGMEFPMMTLIGDYNERGDSALYYVTAHELAHMWVPMTVSNDERRRSWMDEGTTSFNENQARMEFFPGRNHNLPDQADYIEFARTGQEGEMMRWSDYHYPGQAFGVASYDKPASVLVALRAVLGDSTFNRAYRSFLRRWAFHHPYPWDLFQTFESIAGRDLSWFWRSWYYETWLLDQAVGGVSVDDSGTRVVIEDRGDVPMPVLIVARRADGTIERQRVPVAIWLNGAREAIVDFEPGSPITRIELDPEQAFPDVDRSNNVWTR